MATQNNAQERYKITVKINIATLLKALNIYYSAPLEKSFKQFRTGAIFFGVGLITVFLANQTMPPSLKQEIIIALALFIAAVGFLVAIMAHIRMIISRVWLFFKNKN